LYFFNILQKKIGISINSIPINTERYLYSLSSADNDKTTKTTKTTKTNNNIRLITDMRVDGSGGFTDLIGDAGFGALVRLLSKWARTIVLHLLPEVCIDSYCPILAAKNGLWKTLPNLDREWTSISTLGCRIYRGIPRLDGTEPHPEGRNSTWL